MLTVFSTHQQSVHGVPIMDSDEELLLTQNCELRITQTTVRLDAVSLSSTFNKYLFRCPESGVAKDDQFKSIPSRRGFKYFDDGKF